jgi:hypothetical protein
MWPSQVKDAIKAGKKVVWNNSNEVIIKYGELYHICSITGKVRSIDLDTEYMLPTWGYPFKKEDFKIID